MLFKRRNWLIKEQRSPTQLDVRYDILDPLTNRRIGVALVYRNDNESPDEQSHGPATTTSLFKSLRSYITKLNCPSIVYIHEDEDQPPVLYIEESAAHFSLRKFHIVNPQNETFGYFKEKLFPLYQDEFYLYNPMDDQKIGTVKRDWKGWHFKLLNLNGRELAIIDKKWAGMAKELLTTADHYLVTVIEPSPSNELCSLALTAALTLDIFFKYNK